MTLTFKEVNEELAKIVPQIKISRCITPTNDTFERKKFLENYAKGEAYNPQYRYQKKPKSIREAKERLIEIKEYVSDKAQGELVKKLLLVIDYLERVGDDQNQIFTHGKPDQKMVAVAKLAMPREKVILQEREIPAKDAKKFFLERIRSYGISDWKVLIKKNMIAKSNVESSKKTLYIKDRKYSFSEINNLIAHEVEVHILRAANGYRHKNMLFALGTSDYLRTEEGLAIMMEQLTGNYNPLRFKFFAARIIAADLAITKSFYEVFDTLHKRFGLSRHNAYIITKRVKRGLKDTSKPGGYIKDHVYFEGFYMIKKFIQGGGDIRPLFAGKISLGEISMANNGSHGSIIIPKAVEAHYQYNSKQTILQK